MPRRKNFDLEAVRTAADWEEVSAVLQYGKLAKRKPAFVRVREDGHADEIHRISGDAEKPGAMLAIWIHQRERDGHLNWRDKIEEPIAGRECVKAILAGDAQFFRDMAAAIEMLRCRKPGELAANSKLGLFLALIHELRTKGDSAETPLPPVRDILAMLHQRHPRMKWSEREVRRWADKIGIPLAGERKPPQPPPPTGLLHRPHKARTSHPVKGIHGALLALGLPRQLVYRGRRFWQREDLSEIFDRAKRNRRELVRRHHADKTGDETQLRRINEAWLLIERLAERHGLKL